MQYSQVDKSIEINNEKWTVSLIVTTTHSLGHTLIAVEGLEEGIRYSIVAHLVPFIPDRGEQRAEKSDLFMGVMPNKVPIRAQVIIKKGETVDEKVGSLFTSKTWSVSRQSAMKVIERINTDASRELNIDAKEPYNFRLLGQLTLVTSETVDGMNCANWSQMMLAEAGITGQGGLIIDFPRTQALPGSRADWLNGFYFILAGIVLTMRARL